METLGIHTPGELLLLSFLTALGLWLALSAYVIVTRAFHDARHRAVRDLERLLRPTRGSGDEATPQVDELIERIPRRRLEHVAADTHTPEWLARPLARHAVARRGRKLVADAAGHRGERGKWRRIRALQILGRADSAEALPLLERASLDVDTAVAGAAIRVLGRATDAGAADVLVGAMRARSHSASQIAARLDAFDAEIPDRIDALLGDADPQLRFWGATLVSRYSDADATQKLADLVHDDDPSVRAAAVETLALGGGEVAERAALSLLADTTPFVRAHAARALGDLRVARAAPLVATLLADVDWWVRVAAKEALEAFGADAVPTLRTYLDHADRFARNGAAEVLQNIGFVESLLADPAPDVDGERVALALKVLEAGELPVAAAAAERVDPGAPGLGPALAVFELGAAAR